MAHFNKRHYEAIALVCQDYRRHAEHFNTRANRLAWQYEIEGRLADMFQADNPQFVRNRFLHACQPGNNVKAKTAHLKAG